MNTRVFPRVFMTFAMVSMMLALSGGGSPGLPGAAADGGVQPESAPASVPTYHWDFGDGQTSTLQNPSHVYTTPGVRQWKVTSFVDSASCSQIGSIDIAAAPLPDLLGQFGDTTVSPISNQVTTSFACQNVGTVGTGRTFNVQVYLSPTPCVTSSSRLAASFTVPSLGANQSAANNTLSGIGYDAGEEYLICWVDREGAVPESDESNNVLSNAIFQSGTGSQPPPCPLAIPEIAPVPDQAEVTRLSCTKTVPKVGTVNVPVAFMVNVTAKGPGTGDSSSPIVGILRFVPNTGAKGFRQGSPSSEWYRPDEINERQFTHVLTRSIEVMETEVTRQMWADLRRLQPSLPRDPSHFKDSSTLYELCIAPDKDLAGMSGPVQNVTWYETVLFANLLSRQEGLARCYFTNSTKRTEITSSNYTGGNYYCNFSARGYRLPTEGEWEYFCRAGTAGPFSVKEAAYNIKNKDCGPLPNLATVAWFCGSYAFVTHAVGTKKANPWKLHDVHGNVWEWVWDWDDWYPRGTVTDHTGPSGGVYRELRGGSWFDTASDIRSASRYANYPNWRWCNDGFRLVRTVP